MTVAEHLSTLPASWFTSEKLFDVEKQAIFQKAWHLVGPVTKFGDKPVKYEIAGNNFEITKDEKEKVHVFYDNGEKVRMEQSKTGLVFVCFSNDAPTMEEFFNGELDALINTVDFTKLPYRRSISYTGHFNWKTMMDGYQECLHCQYTHPSFCKRYPATFYAVENHSNFSRHIADPNHRDDGLFLYFFPICTLNVYGGGMSMFRVCPLSSTECRMEFDYFFNGNDEDFEEYYQFVRQVAFEDYELCERAQENLEKGVYSTGILNPNKENGVLYYQNLVKEKVLNEIQVAS